MQFVKTNDLVPGMRLAKPIYNRMGVLLYERNTAITMPAIKSIENFGLIGIFVLEPAEPVPPLSKEDLEFEQFQTIYMFRLKDNLDKLQRGELPDTLVELAENIVERYGSLRHKLNFTQNLRSSVDYVYKHAIGAAILTAMISNIMGYTQKEKKSFVTAALVYDLGYLFVPRNIMDKGDNQNAADKKIIKSCRNKGYELLHPNENPYLLPPEALHILPQVHALLDGEKGTSYPTAGTKILITADMFDRMTAMNLTNPPVSEIAAIRYLQEFPKLYDPKMVSALGKCIHILPAGCCVDLTTGDKGLVVEENAGDFMHPLVLCFRDNQIYDLSDPAVFETMQITDTMKTMDNRIKIDKETLKHFKADEQTKQALSHYQKRRAEKLAKGLKMME